jgi:ABC-2 type transport system permease protein
VLVVTAIGVYWFQVPFKGNIIFLAINSLIFLLGAMGIGLLVSTVAHSSQESMQIALLATLLPAITLSGFVFPLESMPWLLRLISFLIPARYFLTILRGIFLKGVGFWCLWDQMLAMSVLSLIILTAAALKFKKRID